MYEHCCKRLIDIVLSATAIVILFPLLMILAIVGAVMMKGDPFFIQERPGKDEKIFKLIKFRTMTCEKDEDGKLLPDELRLSRYGKILRSTSLDELPELLNILKGDMSIVGPRPLLIKYLPLYSERQRLRHSVRPGLTGYAQVNGRNAISWTERFELDLAYVENVTFAGDLRIVFKTIMTVLRREGISSANSVTMDEFDGGN